MTAPIIHGYVAYDGFTWMFTHRPTFEPDSTYLELGVEVAPSTAPWGSASLTRTFRIDEEGQASLHKVQFTGWKLDAAGQRILPGRGPLGADESSTQGPFALPSGFGPKRPDHGAREHTVVIDTPQTVTTAWVISKDLTKTDHFHSWMPSPGDFADTRTLVLEGGRVVEVIDGVRPPTYTRKERVINTLITWAFVAVLAGILAAFVAVIGGAASVCMGMVSWLVGAL